MLKTKEHETTIREVDKKRRNKEILRIYQTIRAMVRTRIENQLMEGDLIDDDGDQGGQSLQGQSQKPRPKNQSSSQNSIIMCSYIFYANNT